MPKTSTRTLRLLPSASALVNLTFALAAVSGACSPMVERAPFPSRPDTVVPGDLLGPYDGIVFDADTERPLAGALVQASWALERGVGMHAPLATREVVTETAADGRYRIPRLEDLADGLSTRVRRFTLVIYHRGHVGWRSDYWFPNGVPRRDFSQRGNRARLEKWQPGLLHMQHVVFLGGGDRLKAAAAWEAQAAALEAAGARPPAAETAAAVARTASPHLLDIAGLLSEDEIKATTGYAGTFEIGKLADLPTTEFYDSKHFKAVGKPETFDVALRVWRLGPAAAEVQYQKLLSELPGARASDEIGDASLRAKAGQISALAFLARDRGVVVSLTCGAGQCPEPGSLLRLAKSVESHLDELPATPASPAGPTPDSSSSEGGEQ